MSDTLLRDDTTTDNLAATMAEIGRRARDAAAALALVPADAKSNALRAAAGGDLPSATAGARRRAPRSGVRRRGRRGGTAPETQHGGKSTATHEADQRGMPSMHK